MLAMITHCSDHFVIYTHTKSSHIHNVICQHVVYFSKAGNKKKNDIQSLPSYKVC